MISKESRIYLLLPSGEDREIGRPKYRKYISKINRSILVKEQHRELLRKFFKDEGFKKGGTNMASREYRKGREGFSRYGRNCHD